MGALQQLLGSYAAAAGGAGIAEVGSGSQRATNTMNNVGSQTLAFPGNVTNGSLLVVGGGLWGGPPTAITVTDTRSTSYTTLLGTINGAWRPFIAYGLAPSSGANTVTVDPDTTVYGGFAIDEFSGVNATPLDVDGGSSTGTSTTPADGITTATANDLIIGCASYEGTGVTIAPGGDYTTIGELEDAANLWTYSLVFRLVTTAQAYTVDWTISSSNVWVAMTAAFKP